MKYTTVHFPHDLLASQGVSSGPSNMWMLVRRWRVLARRCLLVAIPLTFIFSIIGLLLMLLPLFRVSSLRSASHIVIILEQVVWVLSLGFIFYAYCKRRHWLPVVVCLLFFLLLFKGAVIYALHLLSIWCARPPYENQYIFTIPFDVFCEDGICTLQVFESETPKMCAIMHDYFHELGIEDNNPKAVARTFISLHVIQIVVGLLIMVHALEDQVRLTY